MSPDDVCGEAGDEIQRLEDHLGGAIAPNFATEQKCSHFNKNPCSQLTKFCVHDGQKYAVYLNPGKPIKKEVELKQKAA